MLNRFHNLLLIGALLSFSQFIYADHDEVGSSIGFNGKFYFSVRSSSSIDTLKEYDGSSINTIKTFESGTSIQSFWVNNKSVLGVVAGSKVYFKTYSYSNNTNTYTLWSYDGSTFEKTFSLASNADNNYLNMDTPFYYNSKLHFTIGSWNSGYNLYSLSGSDTTKVVSISSSSQNNAYNFIVSGSNLFFTQYAYESGSAKYYWKKYDGSSISTLVTESQYFGSPILYDNKIYWNYNVYSNGSYTYTLKYYDINNNSTGGGSSNEKITVSNGSLNGPVVLGSKLVFFKQYWSSDSKSEIVAYDGTSFSTLVSSSNAGGYIAYNSLFHEYQNRLLWSASSSGSSGNFKLYAYDGSSVYEPQNTTTPPTKLATRTTSAGSGSNKVIGSASETNDIFYYSIKDNSASSGNYELWSYTIAAPAFETGYPMASNISKENFEIKVKTDKAGKVYYVVLSDGATAPTAAEVKAGTGSSGASAVTSSNATLSAETEKSLSISTSISGNTSYDVYVVVEDNSSSPLLQSSPTLVNVTTSANTLPLFASGSPSVSVASNGTSATLSITADVAGTAYYVLLANNAAEPSATDVKNGTGKAGGSTYTDGNVTITANTASTASLSSLTESTEYDAWLVVEDNSSNIQTSASKVDINTDKTSPTITSPVASGITTTTFDFSYKINESGTGYYVVLKKGGSVPTATQIKNGQDFSGNTDSVIVASSVILQSNIENVVSVAGLSSETQYTLHLAAEDANSNIANTSSGLDVTTVALPKKITIASSGATASGATSDYTTIQAGISIAKVARDTLVVSAGIYTENIDFGGKDIFIKSESGPQTTILKPANTGIPVVSFIGNETSSATLKGFTLSGGGTIRGSAIQLNNSSPTIENCIITNSKGEGAISFYYSSATLKNCLIYNNTGSNPLYFDLSTSSPEFINCTIANNIGYGAGYSAPALTIAPIFRNSILWGNTSGGATGRYTIENSIVEGGFPSGLSVLAADPLFVNPENGDFKLSDYSPAIGTARSSTATVEDLADSVRGSTPDMGAYENKRSVPLTDTVIPIVNYVKEGLSGNDSHAGSNTQLSFHWNGSDAASGIGKYEYAIDDVVGESFGGVLGWTSAGIDTSVTVTGLTLVEGNKYFISVRASDRLGNVSSIVTSDGVIIDLTAPSIGIVLHGSNSHLSWLGDTSSVTASWSGFSDGASGIKEYEVMIRDSTGKTNETDWVIISDSVISHTFTGLDLDNNSQYFLKAKASDQVGNMSSVVESALFQVDNEKPLLSSVYECHQDSCDVEDLDWFALDGDPFRLAWVVTDNGSLSEHQLAIGTSKDTDDMMTRSIVLDPMTSENGDSLSFLFGDYYEEGQIYYTNVQVKDKAGNLSGIVSSDGFQIDALPPSIGEVTEGDGEDLDISTSMTSIRVSWKGFDDVDSGIDHYLVSLGSEPGEDDIQNEIEVSDSEFITITDLNLQHGKTYYSSVVAVDIVGNESEKVTSDGFAVDEYPGPPSVTNISPGNDTFLSLVSDENIILQFSEPIDTNIEIILSSAQGNAPNFSRLVTEDSLKVELKYPLTSLDTIFITLSDFADLSGRVAEDTVLTFYTELLGDYNHDQNIDAADLASLASSWNSQDYSFELGPVSGEAPHFIPQPDEAYNLRDVMAYTRMWHWNRGSSNVLNFTRSTVGDGIDVSYVDNNLNVIVPESVIAGQLAFQTSSNETVLTLPEEKSGEVILLSHFEPVLNESLIDFAYLKGEGNRSFVLPLQHGRESSTINMSYVFYNSERNVFGEGIKSIDIIPLPAEFVLDQNYPNPFNPRTRIEYGLPVNSDVNLTVYDLLGQEVQTLISRDYQQAGYHNSIWDGRNKQGQIVSAGVYIYRLVARGDDGKHFALTKKMILLK